ncbi:MAG: mechanosensitive ion channel family protein [Gemmatimonadota bacterium]
MSLDFILYQNTLRAWLAALIVATAVYLGLAVAKRLLLRNLGLLAQRTRNSLDDSISEVVGHTRYFFMLLAALYAGSRILVLPNAAVGAIRVLAVVGLTVQAALWGNALIGAFVTRKMRRREADQESATTVGLIGFVMRLLLWSVLALLSLDNLGIDITALVAGLGIGGIAVALAVQNVLGDVLASLSIVLDRPFEAGDFIIVGDAMGTVERVGVKTTRVRALSGEQLVFSNADLLGSRIRNFKRMYERRVVFGIGVVYQTPRGQLEQIPNLIRDIIQAQDGTRFDRSHFKSYGAFSLDYETVYYVLDPDYNRHMDIQQAINLAIFEQFENQGIEFAYPTQTVVLEGVPARV